jgi:acyl carrier protein
MATTPAKKDRPMPEIQEDDDLVFHKICALLDPLNHKGVKLTRETDLIADLEIDSVSVLDIVMDIEDNYDLSIPVNTISETRTIGELVDAIHAIKQQQA